MSKIQVQGSTDSLRASRAFAWFATSCDGRKWHCQVVGRVWGMKHLRTCGSADRGPVSGRSRDPGLGEQVAGDLVPGAVAVGECVPVAGECLPRLWWT